MVRYPSYYIVLTFVVEKHKTISKIEAMVLVVIDKSEDHGVEYHEKKDEIMMQLKAINLQDE